MCCKYISSPLPPVRIVLTFGANRHRVEREISAIEFIWLFCLGALIWCLLSVAATLAIKPPPFYTSVIDIRYLILGETRFINTPGMSNLLALFPIVFLAGFILKPNQRPPGFWIVGIAGFILSLCAGFFISQRSIFLLALIITPLIVSIFLSLIGSWRSLAIITSLLVSYPFLHWINSTLGNIFLNRPINEGLAQDGRFQMLWFWLGNFIDNPFQRRGMEPPSSTYQQWFHNFFADIHRLSGFWALLAAVVLVSYIFFRVICVIRLDRRFGLFLMAIAIPCFLIMNTSVVPEGERQPFLLLIAIGAIAEVALAQEKRKTKNSQITAPCHPISKNTS